MMRVIFLRPICVAIVSIQILWGGIASAAQREIDSPLKVQSDAIQGCVQTKLDTNLFRNLKNQRQVTIRAFPVSRSTYLDLNLRRIDVFAPGAKLVVVTPNGEQTLPRPDVTIFAGTVVGDAESDVFLSFSPQGSNGWIHTQGATHIMSSGRTGGDDVTIFDPAIAANTVAIEPFLCHIDESTMLQIPVPVPDKSPASPRVGLPPCQQATLAIETDFEYLQLFAGDTAAATAYVATLVGAASSVYERDVSVKLQVAYLRLWETSDDPWDQQTRAISFFNSETTGMRI